MEKEEQNELIDAIFKAVGELKDETKEAAIKAAKEETAAQVNEIVEVLSIRLSFAVKESIASMESVIDKLFSKTARELAEHEAKNEKQFNSINKILSELQEAQIGSLHISKYGYYYILLIVILIALNIIIIFYLLPNLK